MSIKTLDSSANITAALREIALPTLSVFLTSEAEAEESLVITALNTLKWEVRFKQVEGNKIREKAIRFYCFKKAEIYNLHVFYEGKESLHTAEDLFTLGELPLKYIEEILLHERHAPQINLLWGAHDSFLLKFADDLVKIGGEFFTYPTDIWISATSDEFLAPKKFYIYRTGTAPDDGVRCTFAPSIYTTKGANTFYTFRGEVFWLDRKTGVPTVRAFVMSPASISAFVHYVISEAKNILENT